MIELEQRGSVTILRMARGKGNSFNTEFVRALSERLGEVVRSPARAVVLTGEGSIFSAGVDLPAVTTGGKAYLLEFVPLVNRFFEQLVRLPKPLVAAVNGHAIAGGCIVTLACDYRILARGNARIGLTELAAGVPFPQWALEIARFAIPRQYMQEVCYLAQTYQNEQALERGLVDEIVDAGQLVDRACDIGVQLGNVPPRTFAITKNQLRHALCQAAGQRGPLYDPNVLESWCAPEILDRVRGFVERTIKAAG